MDLKPAENDSCERCDLALNRECALMPLCKAEAGKKVKVAGVNGERGLCARMAALGIYPGVEMHLLCNGCVRVNGGVLSLGRDISDKILVTRFS
jgi:ferrous iron transport protein A